jgi:hypothetical protein
LEYWQLSESADDGSRTDNEALMRSERHPANHNISAIILAVKSQK